MTLRAARELLLVVGFFSLGLTWFCPDTALPATTSLLPDRVGLAGSTYDYDNHPEFTTGSSLTRERAYCAYDDPSHAYDDSSHTSQLRVHVSTKVFAAKAGGGPVIRGGAPELFDLHPRVLGQLGNPRLGPLAGRLQADDLQRLANAPSASRYLDARTGNINVIQSVQGVTLRITTPRDAMRIISVGPIRPRQVTNRVASGDFVPLP